jgi:transcriptional regulator with XRE-family HTH domain
MRTPTGEAAELVRDLRTEAGLSVRALARGAGLSPSTVTRIESGAVDPGLGTLRRLAAAAGRTMYVSHSHTPHPSEPQPSSPAARLAALSDALRHTRVGTSPDWTRLRGFVDWTGRHGDRIGDAIADRPEPSGSPLLDTLLAGIAEKLADDAGLPRPAWAAEVEPLRQPWRALLPPADQERERESTPPQLAARGIELGAANLWRAATLIHG